MTLVIKVINGIRNYSDPENPESICPVCKTLTGLPSPPYDIPCNPCYQEASREAGYRT